METCGLPGHDRPQHHLSLDLTGDSLDTPKGHVAKLVLTDSPVTLSSSLSVEEPTLECVAESKAISIVTLMHLNHITMNEQPLLTVPMLVVPVSHMTVPNNTSGHLQPVV